MCLLAACARIQVSQSPNRHPGSRGSKCLYEDHVRQNIFLKKPEREVIWGLHRGQTIAHLGLKLSTDDVHRSLDTPRPPLTCQMVVMQYQ